MFRSTSSSGIKQFDAGYRAKRIFVSVLFVYSASAPRNERSIDDLSMNLKNPDSLEKTDLRHPHSLIPPSLPFVFFFLYALKCQLTESKDDQQHMSPPAGPASTFMVIQSQFLLQLQSCRSIWEAGIKRSKMSILLQAEIRRSVNFAKSGMNNR